MVCPDQTFPDLLRRPHASSWEAIARTPRERWAYSVKICRTIGASSGSGNQHTQRARQAIDAVDEQHVELAGPGCDEGLLQARPVGGCARPLIDVDRSDGDPAGLTL